MNAIRKLVLVFLLISTIPFSGCRQETQQKPAPPPPTIGVSVVSEGFQEIMGPFKEEILKLSRERQLKVSFKEAKEPGEQPKQLEELLKQKPEVIIAFMPEAETARKLSQKAKEEDIKLMAVGVLPPDTPLDGFVGVNARRIGIEQGEFLVEALRSVRNPKVLILNTDPGDPTETQVLEGNREGLKALPGVQLFERTMPTTDISLKLNRIWAETGPLDGVITHDSKAMKMVLISLAGQPFRPVTIGIGADKELAGYIAGGHHHAEVDVQPETMADYAFEGAVHLAETGEWEFDDWVDSGSYQVPVQYSPTRIITRENVSLLQPRHGKIEPKSPDGQSQTGAQDKQEKQEEQQQSKGSKIKVKLKEGRELEFQVPGEIETIEIEGQSGGQGGAQSTDEKKGESGEQGGKQSKSQGE